MIKSLVKILVYFVLFIAIQVLIMDNIYLFRIATPFLYLYIIVKIPVNVTRSPVIAISFLVGIVIDIFSNTLGMHAAACSLAGMIRNPLIFTFAGKGLTENDTPSYRTLGVWNFMKYVFLLVAVHHVTLFLIECVSLFDPVFLMIRIFACVILTVVLIFIVEAFNITKKQSDA
jgi:rod shape-determining protein MreD